MNTTIQIVIPEEISDNRLMIMIETIEEYLDNICIEEFIITSHGEE